MNARTKVSAKGQIVIPKDVRDRLAWGPGTSLDVVETAYGLALRKSSPAKPLSFEEATARLRAAARYDGPRFSDAEEKAAIDAMFREQATIDEGRRYQRPRPIHPE